MQRWLIEWMEGGSAGEQSSMDSSLCAIVRKYFTSRPFPIVISIFPTSMQAGAFFLRPTLKLLTGAPVFPIPRGASFHVSAQTAKVKSSRDFADMGEVNGRGQTKDRHVDGPNARVLNLRSCTTGISALPRSGRVRWRTNKRGPPIDPLLRTQRPARARRGRRRGTVSSLMA